LNVVEFGMNVQETCETANVNSYQVRSSFGAHDSRPGKILGNQQLPSWVRTELGRMGYTLDTTPRTSGPIDAIYFVHEHGSMWERFERRQRRLWHRLVTQTTALPVGAGRNTVAVPCHHCSRALAYSTAFTHMLDSDVKYRFVIVLATLAP
jgi:hypothetical protein